MTIPTFNPPSPPHVGSEILDTNPQHRVRTHAGYDIIIPELIRPRKVARLFWDNMGADFVDYIDSFFGKQLEGTSGPFWWTPFDNVATPSGVTPTLTQYANGALGAKTYYVKITWYDSTYGETKESAQASIAVSANYMMKVAVPPLPWGVEGWRVYASETSGSEVLEATITDGSLIWTQTAALSGSGSPPSTNTLVVPLKWVLAGNVQKKRTSGILSSVNVNLLQQLI